MSVNLVLRRVGLLLEDEDEDGLGSFAGPSWSSSSPHRHVTMAVLVKKRKEGR